MKAAAIKCNHSTLRFALDVLLCHWSGSAAAGLHPVIAQVNGPLASFLIHFVRCYHSLEPTRAAGNWMTIFSMLDRQEPFRQDTILDEGILGHLRCLIIKPVKTVTIFPCLFPGTLGPVVVLSFNVRRGPEV